MCVGARYMFYQWLVSVITFSSTLHKLVAEHNFEFNDGSVSHRLNIHSIYAGASFHINIPIFY